MNSGKLNNSVNKASVPQIEFYGRDQVTVEDCCGVDILEYDTETIKVSGTTSHSLFL